MNVVLNIFRTYFDYKNFNFRNNLYFQVFARFLTLLNFLLPTLSWIFIFEDKSPELNECLGKGYLNFLPKVQLCSNESQLNEIFCWSWLSLLLILQSDVIDVFCIFWCFKDINRATEEARHMLSNQAYVNRKRYDQMFYSKIENHNTYNSFPCIIIFRDNGITIQIFNYQVYTELSIFLGLIIARLLPCQNNMAQNIVRVCATFAIFVIQPLFYLNGDVNFRKRVKDQGLWKALKRELFQSNSHIQPVP